MKAAIIGENQKDCNRIAELLRFFASEYALIINVEVFLSAETFFQSFRKEKYQLVLIELLPVGDTGMQTARRIYASDASCRIVFTAECGDYAVESYEVEAAYYLLKPVFREKFFKAMEIACRELLVSSRCIRFSSSGIPAEVPAERIYYVDVVQRKACIHLKDRVLRTDGLPADVLVQLDEKENFLDCNRSILVNMDHIMEVTEQDFVMNNRERVPIKQRGRAGVKKKYLQYTLRLLRKRK